MDQYAGPVSNQDSPVIIAVDGKESRRAKSGTDARVFLLAALGHRAGAVIGRKSIGEKTNLEPSNESSHRPALRRQSEVFL